MGYSGFNTKEDMAPSLVLFKGTLHMFYIEEKGKQIEHAFSNDQGASWESYDTLQGMKYFVGTASAAPFAIVNTNGDLCVFYRDGTGSDIYCAVSSDGATFPHNDKTGYSCEGQPGGAIDSGNLLLSFNKSKGSTAMLCNPGSGNSAWGIQQVDEKFPVTMAYFQNKLYCIYKAPGKGTTTLEYKTSIDKGYTWTTAFTTNCTTSSAPFAVVINNVLNVFYRDGAGKGILHTETKDGVNWGPGYYGFIGIGCRIQPTAAAYPNGYISVAGVDPDGKGIMFITLKGPVAENEVVTDAQTAEQG